jgi:hypothetical protein
MIEFDELTHVYHFNKKWVPSVSQILLDEGFINATWFTNEGRVRGTGVHKSIKEKEMGAGCKHDPSWEPYLKAYEDFKSSCNWRAHTIEKFMACSTFAGTPDQIGHMNGVEAVVDVKTGGISKVTGLQLAAYQVLYGHPLKRYALQLTAEGRFIITEYKDRRDAYVFESAVAIFWWKQNNLKGGKDATTIK